MDIYGISWELMGRQFGNRLFEVITTDIFQARETAILEKDETNRKFTKRGKFIFPKG